MAGSVTNQHVHTRLDWEEKAFALRSTVGLETKRGHFAVISDIY